MILGGVPVLDWLLLALALGLGVEAWLTTRPQANQDRTQEKPAKDRAEAPRGPQT